MLEVVIFKKINSSVLEINDAYVKHVYAFDGNINDRPYSEKFARDLYASFFFDGDIRLVKGDTEITKTVANMFDIYNRQIVKHTNDQAYLRGSSVTNHAGVYRKTPEIYPMYGLLLETSGLGEPPSKTGTALMKMCSSKVMTLPNSIYVSPTSKYYKKSRVDRQTNTLQLVSISYDEKFAKAVFFTAKNGINVVIGDVHNERVTFNVWGKTVTMQLSNLLYIIE